MEVFMISLEGIKTLHLNLFLPMLMPHTNYVVKKFLKPLELGRCRYK